MTTEQPLVTIIIPAFNAAEILPKAIDSVLLQTYRPIELLVVDDGSTDGTRDVIRRYGRQVTGIHKPNGGLSSARNAGIQAASGEYLCFLDADDYWEPEKLEVQVSCLQSHPDVGFCSTQTRIVNETGEKQGSWCYVGEQAKPVLHTLFRYPGCIAGSGSGVMLRAALLSASGMFDENLASLEDVDLWMRLAEITRYHYIERELTVVYKHADSMSGNRQVMRNATLDVFRNNRRLLPHHLQGAYWRRCLGLALYDYAMWAYRENRTGMAVRDLLLSWKLAPLANARCSLRLLWHILTRKPLPGR